MDNLETLPTAEAAAEETEQTQELTLTEKNFLDVPFEEYSLTDGLLLLILLSLLLGLVIRIVKGW